MLLRRYLHTRIHPPKINVSASAPRSGHSDGLRTSGPLRLHCLSDASTPTSASRTERGLSDQANRFSTNIGEKVSLGTQSPKTDVASGELTRGQSLEDLKQALSSGNPTLIEDSVKDLLRREGKWRDKSQTWDLVVQDFVLRVLSLPTLQAVLSAIRPRTVHLSAAAITQLVQRLLSPSQSEDVERLLTLLHLHVLYLLRHSRRVRSHSVTYIPPCIIRPSFIFLNAFLSIDQKKAMAIFHALVDSGHIPSEAMVDSSSSQTLEQIISMSLVKASLYWNWKDIAEDILERLLQPTSAPDSFTVRHATDCLYTLLISPSPNDLHRCFNLIRLLHPHSPVPDALVRQFYQCAVDINVPSVAEEMYDFSRESTVLDAHSYPAPRGRALTWLMTYLAEESKKAYLVRILASDVVQNDIPIPVDQRSNFISTIAERGLASPARALWERYSVGKDGSIILGDSSLMLRMSSLFTNLARHKESKADSPEDDISYMIEMRKVEELRSFVEHIIMKFKEHHEPWEDADHRAMTSYARACFIVGKNAEGFDIFKVLLKRLELPDLYDVNVALSAIAKQAPEAAGRMVGKMEKYGVRPDAVSIGTVLHHASTQRCKGVVEEMIHRVLAIPRIHSDVKAFGALVRAVVQPEKDETRETRVLKLQSAWELVHQFTKKKTLISTQLGNYLVSLAIEAQDASLAFKFWDALLKDSAEYDDERQRRQRNAIVVLTLAQNMRAEISGTDARMIINQIKKRDGK